VIAFPAFAYEVLLGATSYRLQFRWNARFAYWVIDLTRADGSAVFEGRKLMLGDPLFQEVTHEGLPEPVLIPLDPSRSGGRIGFADMGNGVAVYAV
jgi:hypothetical protein